MPAMQPVSIAMGRQHRHLLIGSRNPSIRRAVPGTFCLLIYGK